MRGVRRMVAAAGNSNIVLISTITLVWGMLVWGVHPMVVLAIIGVWWTLLAKVADLVASDLLGAMMRSPRITVLSRVMGVVWVVR